MTISLRHSILLKYHQRSQSHVSSLQSGTEATLQNHSGYWGSGRLRPASDFMGGSFWTGRIWEGYWQLCRGPEHTCPLVIYGSYWQLLSEQLATLSSSYIMGVDISLPPWYYGGGHQWNDSVYAVRCYRCVPRCPPYIKNPNYPNLQRWQIDLDI